MDGLQYQVDWLKAINQRLTSKERMYQLICDTTECAYLYYSFDRNEVMTMGRWDAFFDVTVKEPKEIEKLLEIVDEAYMIPLREVLFLEKSGENEKCIECMQKDTKIWLQFSCKVV